MPLPMPRLAGLPDDAPITAAPTLGDALNAQLAPRVARLGYLGGFFGVSARQPAALEGFIAFTEALKVTVPSDLTEVVALRVAKRLGNSYEHAQHIALSRASGMSEVWIADVAAGEIGSELLTEIQRDVLALTETLLDHSGHAARENLEQVITSCGEDLAVGIVLLVSRYIAHAHAANAFGLIDPLASPSPAKDPS